MSNCCIFHVIDESKNICDRSCFSLELTLILKLKEIDLFFFCIKEEFNHLSSKFEHILVFIQPIFFYKSPQPRALRKDVQKP